MAFPLCPGNGLDFHATGATIDPPHGVKEKHRYFPQRNKLEATSGKSITSRSSFPTAGTDRPAIAPGPDLHFNNQPTGLFQEAAGSVYKTSVLLNPIQDSLNQHSVFHLLVGFARHKSPYQKRKQNAFCFGPPSGKYLSYTICLSALTGTHKFC